MAELLQAENGQGVFEHLPDQPLFNSRLVWLITQSLGAEDANHVTGKGFHTFAIDTSPSSLSTLRLTNYTEKSKLNPNTSGITYIRVDRDGRPIDISIPDITRVIIGDKSVSFIVEEGRRVRTFSIRSNDCLEDNTVIILA